MPSRCAAQRSIVAVAVAVAQSSAAVHAAVRLQAIVRLQAKVLLRERLCTPAESCKVESELHVELLLRSASHWMLYTLRRVLAAASEATAAAEPPSRRADKDDKADKADKANKGWNFGASLHLSPNFFARAKLQSAATPTLRSACCLAAAAAR